MRLSERKNFLENWKKKYQECLQIVSAAGKKLQDF